MKNGLNHESSALFFQPKGNKECSKKRNSHGSNSQNMKTKGNAVALSEGFSLLG